MNQVNAAKEINMGVMCRDANGSPDIALVTVTCTQAAIDNGDHYAMACELAEDAGYEGPMIAFDSSDSCSGRLGEAQDWLKPACA